MEATGAIFEYFKANPQTGPMIKMVLQAAQESWFVPVVLGSTLGPALIYVAAKLSKANQVINATEFLIHKNPKN